MLPWNDAENDYVDARIGNSPSGGDGNWEGSGMGRGSLNYPIIHDILWWKWVHNRHQMISSPQGSIRMTQPQASPFPLWVLSLAWHLLVWPVQYIHRLHLKLEFGFKNAIQNARDTTPSLVNSTGTTSTENWVFVNILGTHGAVVSAGLLKLIKSRPRYLDLGFAHIDLKSFSLHSGLSEDQLLLQFPRQWCPGHLHRIYILYKTFGWGLPERWRTVVGSGESLVEPSLSHWTLHSGCNQHALCFWHFHTCSVWGAPATPQLHICERSTR